MLHIFAIACSKVSLAANRMTLTNPETKAKERKQ